MNRGGSRGYGRGGGKLCYVLANVAKTFGVFQAVVEPGEVINETPVLLAKYWVFYCLPSFQNRF
jgi:hypothetical protein